MQTLNTMQTDLITGGAIESTETLEIEKLKDDGSSQIGAFDRSNHWTSNNNNLFSTVVRNAGIGAIGGALGGPWGAAAGAVVGAMVGTSQYYGNK